MRICGLVPAYNEGATIASVLQGARPFLDDIVVVDDGSEDETALVAERAGARVVRHAHNQGKGVAVRTGLSHVLPDAFSHVLFIDADLQHDPSDIPLLVDKARNGVGDFVVAERSFDRESMPRARYYANTIGSQVMSLLTATPIRDSQSGFRLIRAELLRPLALTARRYEIEAEILVKLVRRGAHVERVPIESTYEGARSKMRPVRDVFRICMLTMHYRYFCRA
jgi:glycosyltransferase involved in cell wall biosynthesis